MLISCMRADRQQSPNSLAANLLQSVAFAISLSQGMVYVPTGYSYGAEMFDMSAVRVSLRPRVATRTFPTVLAVCGCTCLCPRLFAVRNALLELALTRCHPHPRDFKQPTGRQRVGRRHAGWPRRLAPALGCGAGPGQAPGRPPGKDREEARGVNFTPEKLAHVNFTPVKRAALLACGGEARAPLLSAEPAANTRFHILWARSPRVPLNRPLTCPGSYICVHRAPGRVFLHMM